MISPHALRMPHLAFGVVVELRGNKRPNQRFGGDNRGARGRLIDHDDRSDRWFAPGPKQIGRQTAVIGIEVVARNNAVRAFASAGSFI